MLAYPGQRVRMNRHAASFIITKQIRSSTAQRIDSMMCLEVLQALQSWYQGMLIDTDNQATQQIIKNNYDHNLLITSGFKVYWWLPYHICI